MKTSLLAASMMCAAFAAPALAQMGADDIARCLRPGANMSTCSSTRGASLGVAVPAQPAAAAQPIRRVSAPVAAAPSYARPTVAPTPVAATTAPAQSSGTAAINLTVQFTNGSAELTPAGMSALDELGKALRGPALAEYKFRIEGHTDAVGTRESNLNLSERRAIRVVDYLRSKYGIEQNRLQAQGMGQDHPLVPTSDGVSEPRNRRVQIVNLGQ